MPLLRYVAVVFVAALLLGTMPVRAAQQGTVKDQGAQVFMVDARRGPPPDILGKEEVDKIKTLQARVLTTQLFSSISPDDQAVLAVIGNSLGFLNIQDGSYLPLDVDQAFNRYTPLGLLGFGGGFVWRDGRTLVSLGVDGGEEPPADSNEPEPEPKPVLVTIDRLTGEVGAIPLPDFPLETFPISISPNGNRLILIASPEEGSAATQLLTVPVVPPRPIAASTELPAALQEQVDALFAASPLLRRMQAYRPFYQQNEGEVSATEEEAKLLVYDTTNGALNELRSISQGTIPVGGFVWSQDGNRLALSLTSPFDYSKEPTRRQDQQPFGGALISEQVYRDVTGNLAPKVNPFFQNNTVEAYDLSAGTSKVLRAADGDGKFLVATSWSTDGQTLLTRALHPGRLAGRTYPVYTPQFAERASFRFYNIDMKEVGRIEAPELSAALSTGATFVSPDEVIFTGVVGTNVHPYYYNRVSGEFRNLADRAGTYVGVQATRLSRQLLFTYTSFTDPPDLYRINWDGKAFYRLTWFNEELRQFTKVRQDPVSFRLANGQVRNGVLLQPADAPFPPRNQRIIVWQEGGPGGPMNNQWRTLVEAPYGLLPSFGFGLLVVPLSGREGYGPAVYNALYDRGNFGQIDIDEQAEIARAMITRGWTAKGKVGITGCSYGGYFTLQSVIRHPDVYAAANPQCALVDTVVEWSQGYAALMPYIQGLPPWANPEEYRRDSPLYNVDKIKAAVLTFHGTEDFLPIASNENLHLQLVNRKVPARMITFLGAGHGLAGRAAQVRREVLAAYEVYAAQEQIQWFRQYLK